VQNKELQGYVCVQVELPKFVGEKPGISQKDALKFCERSENNAIDTVTINRDLTNLDTLFPDSMVSYFDSKWNPQQQQLSSSIQMISSQLPLVGESSDTIMLTTTDNRQPGAKITLSSREQTKEKIKEKKSINREHSRKKRIDRRIFLDVPGIELFSWIVNKGSCCFLFHWEH